MFLTELVLKNDPAPCMWIFVTPLVWEDPVFGHIEVPTGFRTDLASVGAFNRNGRSRRPAALHDWCYAWRGIGRDNADLLLKAAMLADGTSVIEAEAFYFGVRSRFGGASWMSDIGALDTRDFDTAEHYAAWVQSKTQYSVGPEVPMGSGA